MLCAVIVLPGSITNAAEICLKARCSRQPGVVLLGDVADIHSIDAEAVRKLAATELFPMPAGSRVRYVTAREVQDLLSVHGISLAEHTFSGASRIAIQLQTDVAPVVEPDRKATASPERTTERVRQAILSYLRQQVPDESTWTVRVELDPRKRQRIEAIQGDLRVVGGASPWVGNQRFSVLIPSDGRLEELSIDANVSIAEAVVVALRPCPRGTVLSAADVGLSRDTAGLSTKDATTRIEDVLGREVVRALVPGQVVTTDSVRQPILVRRGDPVTVYARSAGVQVRTIGTAREDGALGDVVTVESRQSRQTYFARVSGPQEVSVYARSVQAETVDPRTTAGRQAAIVSPREGG